MSDTIKTAGVKLTLDGQAEFLQNIRVVNQELRLNYQELRLVREQQKLQGDSTELLAQKASILSNEYNNQVAKIKGLNEAQQQAKKEYGENSEEVKKLEVAQKRAEVSLEALKRQIFYNTIELEKQKSGLYQTGIKFDEFGQKAQKAGEKLNKIGTTMTIGVTAPLMAGAAYAVKAATDMNAAMIGVQKTTDMTGEELAAMEQQFINMSKEIPSTAVEIANVAEVAGQLGIEKEHLVDFTRVVIDMGNATNIAGEEGAAAMAKFANITQMSQKDFDRFGSSIVQLGNNTATTENDILQMSMRLAAAGAQAGMSEADILGISAALSSLGIEAQAGGTAFSKVITRLQLAVETGSDDLDMLAAVAGMTADEFKKAFEQDAANALKLFVSGLGDAERHGKSTSQILEDLEIKEVRMADALRRTSGAGDLLNDTLKMSNDAWDANTALVEEAALKYSSAESQFEIQKNKLQETAITIGKQLLPHVLKLAEGVSDLIGKFNDLNPQTQKTILYMLGIAAAAGPTLKIFGSVSTVVGKLSSGIGNLMKKLAEKSAVEAATTAISGLGAAAGTAATSAAGMSTGLSAFGSILTGPVGIIAGVGALAGVIYALITHSEQASEKARAMREEFDQIGTTFEKSKDDAMVQAAAAEYQTGKLFELAKVENKTNAEKMQMKQMVQKLNELVPDLSLAYDSVNDTLSMTEDDIKKVTAAMKDQMIIKALTEAAGEYVAMMAKAGNERDKIKSQLEPVNRALETYKGKLDKVTESQKYWDAVNQGMSFDTILEEFPELKGAYEDLAKVVEETGIKHNGTHDVMIGAVEKYLKEQGILLDEQKDIYDDAEKQFDSYSNQVAEKFNEISEASEESTESQIEDTEAVTQATLDAVAERETAIATFAENVKELEEYISDTYNTNLGKIESRAREHQASMGSIEAEGIERSELTVAQVQANLTKQIADFTYWRENIQGIAGRVPNDVYYELSKLGPKYAPLMAELNAMNDTQLTEFANLWKEKSQLSVDMAADEFDKMPENFSSDLDTISTLIEKDAKVQAATKDLTKRMVIEWEEAGRNTKLLGQKIPKDVAIEIMREAPSIKSAAQGMGQQGVSGFSITLPEIWHMGTQWAYGAIQGILSQKKAMYNATWELAHSGFSGFSDRSKMRSPSKAAYDQSGLLVAGHLKRLKEAEKELYDAGSDLAKSYQDGFDRSGKSGQLSIENNINSSPEQRGIAYITINTQIADSYDVRNLARDLDRELGSIGASVNRGRGRA